MSRLTPDEFVLDQPIPEPTESRTTRRMRRTRASLVDALVSLVLEQGYPNVSVDDILLRADVSRGTFYAYFPNKEALLREVFTGLIDDLIQRTAFTEGPWNQVRTSAIEEAYAHAARHRDLYRACLSESWARREYIGAVAQSATENFRRRLDALDREPRVPVPIMAEAFAGAHVALLEAWLDGRSEGDPIRLARQQLDLLIGGLAWAHGLERHEMYPAAPGAERR